MKEELFPQDIWKHLVGEAAAGLVEDGMVIGLGSGTTAAHLAHALARRLQGGLRIIGAVPTSQATAELAHSLHIPLTTLDIYPELDLAIDGADEIDAQLNLIKGAGGALLREKIVATAARHFVVIGDITKQVERLGQKMPLPIEVIPFAMTPVRRRLEALGARVALRLLNDQPYITDSGNIILDCAFPGGIVDAAALESHMHQIVGVVESGLFLHIAGQAIIAGPDGVKYVS